MSVWGDDKQWEQRQVREEEGPISPGLIGHSRALAFAQHELGNLEGSELNNMISTMLHGQCAKGRINWQGKQIQR